MMKKSEYGERVQEVELASFTPLVFSTTGGMGREESVFFIRDWQALWPISRVGHMVRYHHFLSSLCSHLFPAEIRCYVYTGQ